MTDRELLELILEKVTALEVKVGRIETEVGKIEEEVDDLDAGSHGYARTGKAPK